MKLDSLPPSTRLVYAAAAAVKAKPHMVLGHGRSTAVVHARWAVMRVLRERGWSLSRIGDKLGGRDHATVVHGLVRSDELYASDPDFAWLCDKVATL